MKVGILGYGHVGKKHHKAYKYINDVTKINIHDTGLGINPSMKDVNFFTYEMDIVSICTPSHVRFDLINKAANRGVNVLVEKPLGLSLEQAGHIIQTCNYHGVRLGVVMQKRFNPDIQKLCGEVRAQTFGKPLIASMVVRWYRPTSYYQGWKGETDKGGSILINQAIHHIDILQWVMGPVRSVFGYARTLGHKINTTDAVVATLNFESGAIGTLEASTVCYPKNAGEHLTVLSEWGHRTIDTAWPHHEPIIRNFVECVRENREPMVTGEESLKSLKIALAIQESSDTGKEVFIDMELVDYT